MKEYSAIFPGYFFILANFDIHPVSALRRHSAFIDFVKFGGEIKPVNKDIVDGLMKIYPDPVLNPGAREELNAGFQHMADKSTISVSPQNGKYSPA